MVSGGFHTTTAELKAVTDCVVPYREVCRPLTEDKALSHVRPQVTKSVVYKMRTLTEGEILYVKTTDWQTENPVWPQRLTDLQDF